MGAAPDSLPFEVQFRKMSSIALSFRIKSLEHRLDVLTLTPVLSGTPLTELVSCFEQKNGIGSSRARAYGGLVPDFFRYGPLERYFLGESPDSFWREGCYLLGCSCGEVGCWPLQARISRISDTVVWDSFRQPHRPGWDYSGFGPFAFALEPYRVAVINAAAYFTEQ